MVQYDSNMSGQIWKQSPSKPQKQKILQESDRSMKRGIDEMIQQNGIEPYRDITRDRSKERVEVQILELTDEEELSQIEQAIEKQMS